MIDQPKKPVPSSPNDLYGRTCEESGHEWGHFKPNSRRCIWCGDFEPIKRTNHRLKAWQDLKRIALAKNKEIKSDVLPKEGKMK